MAEAWEALADQLKDMLIEEGREFVEAETDAYKEFMAGIAKDLAKQTVKAGTASSSQDRALAKSNIEYLMASAESRIAGSQLELVAQGDQMLKKIIKTAGKTLLSVMLSA